MSNPYESERMLGEYLFFHYPADGWNEVPLPREALNFPRRVVDELLEPAVRVRRALDIGCAVGRSAFELTRFATGVIGIDYSATFIAAARELKEAGSKSCRIFVEGESSVPFLAAVPGECDRVRVIFEEGDAMALREDLGSFDVVLAANLICRLPDPRVFLRRLPELVVPGGQLLLATPFSWLREYTPPENWLGGRDGGAGGWEGLKACLEEHFELECMKDVPFLIREHARKYQYGISLGSRWRRR